MPQIVSTTCNQCERNDHDRCPAEVLAKENFIKNPGDHCLCAFEGHKTPQTTRITPIVKSMFSKQSEERDVATNTNVQEKFEEDEID